MTTIQVIENHLNIEIGDRQLRNGRKYPDKNKYYRYDDYYIVSMAQDTWMIVSNERKVRKLLKEYCFRPHDGYGRTSIGGTTKKFHQLYLNYGKGLVCDHINHCRWDNRNENLRVATISQNNRNRTLGKRNTSGKLGICKYRNSWIAFIQNNEQKKIKKYFSIKTYGDDEAKQLATNKRKEWETQYGYLGE